jgi:alpha-amylase
LYDTDRLRFCRARRLLPDRMRTTPSLSLAILVIAIGFTPARAGRQPAAPTENGLVYEIFVRSFADSNGDGIGDLRGIATRLDSYLNDGRTETDMDLEAGIVWLMPVFPSPSYHGYDVSDFRTINRDYGSLAEFDSLVAEAHRRGLRIILDLPLNHTSREHPWFKAAVTDPHAPERAYYHIEPDTGASRPGWHSITSASGERLRYLGLFSPSMPDLNFGNPAVREQIKGIATFWIDRGADGFRLDAAKHIFGDTFERPTDVEILRNNEWWRDFSHALYRRRADAILVGEVLGDREMLRRHAWGLDGLLDEPFMNEVRGQLSAPGSGLLGRYKQFVDEARALNRTVQSFPFVASHDRNPRLASDLEEMQARGVVTSVDGSYRVAMYALLMIPAHPIIYMGDEVMQRGWKWRGSPPDDRNEPGDGSGIFDETLREPFPWYRSGNGAGQTTWFHPRFDRPGDGVSREEQAQPGGMLDLVRGMTNFRSKHPAFANGDIGAVLSDSAEWLVFERGSDRDRYLVLVNETAARHEYRFHAAWYPQWIGARRIFWSDGARRTWKDATSQNERITDSVDVPAFGLVILRQTPS